MKFHMIDSNLPFLPKAKTLDNDNVITWTLTETELLRMELNAFKQFSKFKFSSLTGLKEMYIGMVNSVPALINADEVTGARLQIEEFDLNTGVLNGIDKTITKEIDIPDLSGQLSVSLKNGTTENNQLRSQIQEYLSVIASVLSEIIKSKIEDLYMMKEEANYRSLVENLNEGILLLDKSGKPFFVNNRFRELLGCEDYEIIGKPLSQFVSEADRVSVLIDNVIRRKDKVRSEVLLKYGKNREVYANAVFCPIQNDIGEITGVIAGFVDVSEKKLAEKALRASENKFRNLFENANDSIFVSDSESMRLIDCNERAARRLGYTKDELLQLSVMDINRQEKYENIQEIRKEILNDKSVIFRHTHIRKDGSEFPVEISSRIVDFDGEKAIQSIVRDISDRVHAEEQIRKLSLVVEQSSFTVVITDVNGFVEYVNPRFSILTGYTSKEILGKKLSMLKSGETPELVYFDLWKTINSGKIWKGEFINRKKDGRLYNEFATISPIKNSDGMITHFVGILEDITEKKAAENQLNRLRSGIEQAFDAVVITDTEGTIQYVNPAFEKISGYSIGEVMGKNPRILKSNRNASGFYQQMWSTIMSGNIWQDEIINRKKDGSLYYEEMTIAPVKNRDDQITNFVAIKRDIGEKKSLELSLKKLRLEYEAFMRHELKNLLTPIMGYSELLLKSKNSLKDKDKELYSTRIFESVERTMYLIDNLKKLQDFETGKYKLYKHHFDMKAVVNSVIEDVTFLAKKYDAEIKLNDQATNSVFQMDSKLMSGVLLNLIKNAIEHVSECDRKSEKTITIHMFNKKEKLITTVNNRGKPIPKEKLTLFFEKFNSDKKKKHGGTGLGTTYAYLVTKAHGGEISVSSDKTSGTTVSIVFDL